MGIGYGLAEYYYGLVVCRFGCPCNNLPLVWTGLKVVSTMIRLAECNSGRQIIIQCNNDVGVVRYTAGAVIVYTAR